MKLKNLILLLIFSITIIGCGKAKVSPRVEENMGSQVEGLATMVKGTVEIQKPSSEEWVILKVKDGVPEGSRLKTGADGEADILLADKAAVRIKPNSELEITGNRMKNEVAKIDVKLNMGRLLHRFDKMPTGSEYHVTTPTAGAVIRGTQFDMSATENKTNFRVLNGKVVVSSANGSIEVKEKEGTSVASGQAPEEPKTLGQKDIDELLECSLVKFTVALERSRKMATQAEMRNVSVPLEVWAASHDGLYPNALEEVDKNLLQDNWNRPYRYQAINGNKGFVITSSGPDKIFNTEDDLEYRRD